MKRCQKCGDEHPLDRFHRDRTKPDGHCTTCKSRVSAQQKRYREQHPERVAAQKVYMRDYSKRNGHIRKEKDRELRRRAIEIYGGKCECCGITGYEFLTFDHVGGWGAQHRAETRYAFSIVKWLSREGWPKDGTIRLLCWNCNCARGVYGHCPHEDYALI